MVFFWGVSYPSIFCKLYILNVIIYETVAYTIDVLPFLRIVPLITNQ